MTLAKVEARIAALTALQHIEPNAAAIGRRLLRDDILVAIADGAPDPRALAEAALRTMEQDFRGR